MAAAAAAATGALRQLLLPTIIRRRLAAGGTTMAQGHGHGAERCFRPYTNTTEAAAHHERRRRLIRETARVQQALDFTLGSIFAASLALIYYGPYGPHFLRTKRNP